MKKIISLCFVVILICGVFSACGGTKISLNDHTTVSFSGLDGRGEAKAKVDTTAIEEILFKGKIEDATMAQLGELLAIEEVLYTIEVTVEPSEGLSNGDKVEVSFTYNEEKAKVKKISFQSKPETFVVEGLTEGKEVDIFEDMEMTYEGYSPNLRVLFKNRSEEQFLRDITFSSDEAQGAANGDTITVKANFSEIAAEDAGIIILETEKQFIIENAPAFKQEIDSADLNHLNKRMDDALEAKLASSVDVYVFQTGGGWVSSTSAALMEGTTWSLKEQYFMNLKKGETASFSGYSNAVLSIYEVTVNSDGVKAGNHVFYVSVFATDLTENEEQDLDSVTITINSVNASLSEMKTTLITAKKDTTDATELFVAAPSKEEVEQDSEAPAGEAEETEETGETEEKQE